MPVSEAVGGGGPQGALAGLVQGYMGEQANMKHEEMLTQVSQHANMVGYLQALVSNNDVPAEHKQWAMGKLGELAQWAPGKKLPKVDLSSLPAANIQQPDRQAVSQAPAMQLGGTQSQPQPPAQLTPPVGPGGVTATPTATPATAPAPSSEVGRSSNGTVNAMGSVQQPVAPGLTTATASKIIPPVAPGDMGPDNAPGSIVTGFDANGRPTLAPNSPRFDLAPPSPVTIPPSAATVIRNPQAPIHISPAGQLHLLTPEEHAMSQQAHIAAAINSAQQQDPSLTRDQAAWRLFHPGEPEPLMEIPAGGTVVNKLTGKDFAYGADKTSAASQKSGYEPQFAPGSHIPTGVKDVRTGAFITPDAAQSIPEAKAVYEQAQAVHKQAQADDIQKELRKDAEANKRADASFDRAVRLSDRKTAEKEVTTAVNNHEDAVDRLQTMQKSYAAALKGDQQAMISILMNHIGMTLGAQKGARMNQATIREAEESAPSMGRIEAKFSKEGYLQGVVLTPDQMKQMVQLAVEKEHILADHVERIRTDFASEFGAAAAGGGGTSSGGTAQPIAPVRTGPGTQTAPQNDNGVTFYPSSPGSPGNPK